MKITEKQSSYLVSLINQVSGTSFKFLSQVTVDGIGKKASKVKGISQAEASAMINEWKAKAESMVAK